jgi:hypothetical protein
MIHSTSSFPRQYPKNWNPDCSSSFALIKRASAGTIPSKDIIDYIGDYTSKDNQSAKDLFRSLTKNARQVVNDILNGMKEKKATSSAVEKSTVPPPFKKKTVQEKIRAVEEKPASNKKTELEDDEVPTQRRDPIIPPPMPPNSEPFKVFKRPKLPFNISIKV